jgi:hypothetical protein
MKAFILNYIEDAKRFSYQGYSNEHLGVETLKKYEVFEERLRAKINS